MVHSKTIVEDRQIVFIFQYSFNHFKFDFQDLGVRNFHREFIVIKNKTNKTVVNSVFVPKLQRTKIWQRRDSNPRSFELVPKTSALDRSATLP
jgi:hypothetical protein